MNIDGFSLLGPFRVSAGGRPIVLPRRQVRFVLAVLLLDVGRPVPVERLVRLLWRDRQPPDARAVLHTYVSRLRKALRDVDGVGLSRVGDAYLLDTDPDLVDVHRFRQLVERVRSAQDAASRAGLAREALALWRGPALSDAGDEDACAIASVGLEELRQQMTDVHIAADLELGRHEQVVGGLAQLVAANPLNERLVVHFATALYRCGRRADALSACRDARSRLADQLGLDPGPELAQLEVAMLRADPALDVARTAPGGAAGTPTADPSDAPAQLPAAGGIFVGRAGDLAALGALRADATAVVVSGPPGVGKTALAVHWGRGRLDQFPDGQLYLDLRGHGPDARMPPLTALTTLLIGLGLPYDQTPVDLDEACGRYRSRLAGRRVLIVLDNAGTVEQVRPLLPPDSGSLALVTSRDALTGLVALDGARSHRLEPFTAAESYHLLEAMLGEGWVAADPVASAGLVQACAHLPLALRIAATHLREATAEALPAYVAALRRGSLRTLSLDGDANRAVRSAFDRSYERLDPQTQALFRVFGLPVVAPCAEVAATVSGIDPECARDRLAHLVAANLCEQTSADTFTTHDLLREYAAELSLAADPAERGRALDRLYAHYLDRVDAAAKLLYPQMLRLPAPEIRETASPAFAGREEARAWLSRESATFLPLVRHAAADGRPETAWLLADWLRGSYWLSQRTGDWLSAAAAGLRAAESVDNRRGMCASQLSLGLANLCMSRYREADRCFTEGLSDARKASWSEGEAACLGGLGSVSLELGDLDGAESNYRDAMLVNRRLGRAAAEATNRGNLAVVQLERGRFGVAAENFRRVIAYQRSARLAASEALNLLNLGRACHELGSYVEAAEHLSAAVTQNREVGNAQGEASSLAQLAAVRCRQGRLDEAMRDIQASLDLIQEFDDPATESEARLVLGAICHRRVEPERARRHFVRAAELADDMSRTEQTIDATIGLALADLAGRDLPAARHRAAAMVDLARERGFRHHEALAMTLVAHIDRELGEIERATELARDALAIHRETGHRLGEARTLRMLGDPAAADLFLALGIDDDPIWYGQVHGET